MANLIFLGVTLVLLGGFFALTSYEAKRGVRVYAAGRDRLDASASRAEIIFTHVNLGAFLRDEIRHLAARIGHNIVQFSLTTVRATERLLTRLMRRLRAHPEVDPAPRETAREFVKVLSEFKDNLNPTQQGITDID